MTPLRIWLASKAFQLKISSERENTGELEALPYDQFVPYLYFLLRAASDFFLRFTLGFS